MHRESLLRKVHTQKTHQTETKSSLLRNTSSSYDKLSSFLCLLHYKQITCICIIQNAIVTALSYKTSVKKLNLKFADIAKVQRTQMHCNETQVKLSTNTVA